MTRACKVFGTLTLCLSAVACANGGMTTVVDGTGGTSTGSGGTSATGGTSASGGTTGSGGTLGQGGGTPTGGSISTGGITSTGGSPASGGAPATGGIVGGAAGRGGAAGEGGVTSSGGSTGKGGSGSGGTTGSGGTGSGGTGTGGVATGGAATGGASGGAGGAFPFNPVYIVGADISWTTQHEAEGYKYSDGTTQRPMEQIMAENGFNYIRLRTFVDPSASDGYSPGQQWCSQADTVTMAKRVKACGLGLLIDFHMSDTWASLGTNANAAAMPLAWRSLSQTVPSTPVSNTTHLTNNLYQTAHDYVYGVMQALVAAGAKPDMVQIGNETNTGMSGISMSNWAAFSALVNAGIKAVRETDPKIIVWAQNGRPRPDSAGGSNFDGWVDDYLSGKSPHTPAIDEDAICGSTYGTTNNGADWTTSFSYVVDTYKVPVMSCEYTNSAANTPAGATINKVMRALPNNLGRGAFIWEPADYPSAGTNVAGTLFNRDTTTKVYTTNSAMTAYPAAVKSYGLPVPAGTCH
jgi:arabinogalactan endo-1,4-beta-galactosidase